RATGIWACQPLRDACAEGHFRDGDSRLRLRDWPARFREALARCFHGIRDLEWLGLPDVAPVVVYVSEIGFRNSVSVRRAGMRKSEPRKQRSGVRVCPRRSKSTAETAVAQ